MCSMTVVSSTLFLLGKRATRTLVVVVAGTSGVLLATTWVCGDAEIIMMMAPTMLVTTS